MISGDILHWKQQVRVRHMATRLYMCVNASGMVTLTDNGNDPTTVFRLEAVIQVSGDF